MPRRYVCGCTTATQDDLLELIAQGADSIDKLGREFGVGRGCGSCAPDLVRLLAEVAQLVEQHPCKMTVAGSTPVFGSTSSKC